MTQIESFNELIGQSFIRLIAEQTGLETKEQERSTLFAKLYSRMQALNLSSPVLYYQYLSAKTPESAQEWQTLIERIVNIESYFFRDKGQFALLKHQILPELIQQKQSTKTLRICSAGCSTGEELYSLAILLTELIPNLDQWNLLLLGLDINAQSLKKAEAGIYRSWSFRGIDAKVQQRYFQPVGDRYQILPDIKQRLRFQPFNLVQDLDGELNQMDLILCRNVFIYFGESAIADVLNKLYHALQPLGYLLTGHAELHAQDLTQFDIKVFPESVIYQRPAHPKVTQKASSLSIHQATP